MKNSVQYFFGHRSIASYNEKTLNIYAVDGRNINNIMCLKSLEYFSNTLI